MLRQKSILFLCLTLLLVALYSCFSKKDECERDKSGKLISLCDSIVGKEIKIPSDIIADLLKSSPRPIAILDVVEKDKKFYSFKKLDESYKYNYTRSYNSKALCLGVHLADLTYVNLNEDNSSSLVYFSLYETMLQKLELGECLDKELYTRVKENLFASDSLQYLFDISYSKIFEELKVRKHNNIGVLIAYGAWIESLYIVTNIPEYIEKKAVIARIGEQRIVLDNMLYLMSFFKKNKDFEEMKTDMDLLSKEFNKVIISYVYSKPSVKGNDGVLKITDNEESNISMSPEVFASIKDKVGIIRGKIVK